jgi:uncharacterized Fe-S cluster-containing protein
MDSISDFMAEPVVEAAIHVTSQTKRKRHDDDGEDVSEMKKKAKFLCKCPEQWTSVNRMSKQRLKEWLSEQDYVTQTQLYGTVADFVHDIYAMMCDKLSRGDGYVESEIKGDLSLKDCIRHELGTIVSYLTNRWKLIALSTIDISNAKRRQLLDNPMPIIEETNGDEPVMDQQNNIETGHNATDDALANEEETEETV